MRGWALPALLLGALLAGSCSTAVRMAGRNLLLLPGDTLVIEGGDMLVTILNQGPGKVRVTALGSDGKPLLPAWEIGAAKTRIRRPDVGKVLVENVSGGPLVLDWTASSARTPVGAVKVRVESAREGPEVPQPPVEEGDG